MTIPGLLSVLAIAVIGYCTFNSMVLNPADVIADNGETVISSRRSYRGPFGIDSQRILNEKNGSPDYRIGVATSIDLEKNDDGTWYVHNCGLKHGLKRGSEFILSLYFQLSYPQQYDLKSGDFIGFAGILDESRQAGRYYYNYGLMRENISSQAANFNIDNIRDLSVPEESGESLGVVTGVIMAVEINKNEDLEPDNPSDYLIDRAVMKCADGNLYIVNFQRRISKLPNVLPVNLPSPDAFGEGDIVSVIQTSAVSDQTFRAYYKKFKKVVTRRQSTETETVKSDVNLMPKAVRDAESDAKSAAEKWWWFGGTCVGTSVLTPFFCGLPSMGIAYIYKPPPPASRLIGKSPEYVEIYQKTYKKEVRSIQTARATWGCIVGSILSAILLASSSE